MLVVLVVLVVLWALPVWPTGPGRMQSEEEVVLATG